MSGEDVAASAPTGTGCRHDVGTALTDPGGRVLWADDAFCTVVGRSRPDLLVTGISDIPGLELPTAAGGGTARTVLRLPPEVGGITVRVSGLGTGEAHLWAWVVEVDRARAVSLPRTASGSRGAVCVFALDGEARLAAVWGPAVLPGFNPAAVGRRFVELTDERTLMAELSRRVLVGEPAVGLIVAAGRACEVHLFPFGDGAGRNHAVGVLVAALDKAEAGRLTREEALLELARAALRTAEPRYLLQRAVALVCRAIGGGTAAVFERLPQTGRFHVRAAVGWPVSAPRLVPAPDLPGDGVLVAPVEGSVPFGYLAVRARQGRALDSEEKSFVAAAAEMVTVGLEHLAGDERRRRAALHDPLTGLPNRTLILDHIDHALARARRGRGQVAILFLDLDRFKLVNDTLGHEAGDELLAAVANRLLAALRPSDTIGRLGGDEFIAVCEDLEGPADAAAIAGRMAAAFHLPFSLSRWEVSTSASIGVALSGGEDVEGDVLRAEADAAMYRAKGQEGPSVSFSW